MPSRIASASALLGTAILLAACGTAAGTASTTSPATSASPIASESPIASPTPAPSPAAGVAIDVAMTRLGDVLVDAKGITLYLFVADKGTTSACYGTCAQVWPPVLTRGTPQPGPGVSASLLGTTRRTDGTVEVTYGGHPLYYFISDKKAGDVTGQSVNGFGGLWYVVGANGMEIK